MKELDRTQRITLYIQREGHAVPIVTSRRQEKIQHRSYS
jgi:hypothetical protein